MVAKIGESTDAQNPTKLQDSRHFFFLWKLVLSLCPSLFHPDNNEALVANYKWEKHAAEAQEAVA